VSASQPTPDELEIDMTDWTPLAPEDVTIADEQLDKFVTEADDITVTPGEWMLSITDGERLLLVQTKAQLLVWCEAQGITLDEFMRDFPIAAKMPAFIKAEIDNG
jgi:hypothetical protein